MLTHTSPASLSFPFSVPSDSRLIIGSTLPRLQTQNSYMSIMNAHSWSSSSLLAMLRPPAKIRSQAALRNGPRGASQEEGSLTDACRGNMFHKVPTWGGCPNCGPVLAYWGAIFDSLPHVALPS